MQTPVIRQMWYIIPAYQFLNRNSNEKKTQNQQVATAQNISMFKEVAVGTQNSPTQGTGIGLT